MSISDHAFKPDEIFLVGAGGSGSRICDEMRYFLRGNYRDLPNTHLTIVDHDRLSARNLNRQMYFPWEISDKSKGQILVERYKSSMKVRQIPEPINADTISQILNTSVLSRKVLVICAADNGLVAKQTITHLLENAQNDWLWVFTGAQMVSEIVDEVEVQTGSGQAYSYGVVNGTPLFPAQPTETLTDIMSITGFGPSATGLNCGVDDTSGAQTPLMNHSCAVATMTIINMFFSQGVFIPAIYFVDGVKWDVADGISVEKLMRNSIPTSVDNTSEPVVESSQQASEGPENNRTPNFAEDGVATPPPINNAVADPPTAVPF